MCFPNVGDNCIIMQLILLILSALFYFPRCQRNGTEGENSGKIVGYCILVEFVTEFSA